MMQGELDNILDTIKKLNPWFKDGKVPEKLVKPYIRQELSLIKKTMTNTDLATLLIGGRRVGKSILLYQLINSLLEDGVEQKRILFIQGDNPILRESVSTANILSTIIEAYEKYILDEDISETENPIYILLDEAQALPNWDAEIKTLIDLKYKIKFLITGSSSSKLREGIQTPLIGRVYIAILSPFSFRDFLGYELTTKTKPNNKIFSEIDEIRKSFQTSLLKGDIFKIKQSIKDLAQMLNDINLDNYFDEYILYGGFPYVIENRNNEDTTKYLRDILQMTFSRDILHEDQIRAPLAFERLMVNICMNISGIFKLKSLAERVGLKDDRTVQRYIDYYVNSHYAFISSQYSFFSRQETIKSNKKIYAIDTGLINALLFKNAKDLSKDNAYKGVLIENLIHSTLLRHKLCITGNIYDNVPYWDNTKTHREIDFIFGLDEQIYPVEVKNKSSIPEDELLEMKTFMKKDEISGVGFVITNSLLQIDEKIIFIPAKYFTLLL
ncbi:hypothetical protein CO058_00110 [candidate division WWE3 bacterium CG_4_9_14_0_2_um_filter_35_11]|uniref:ATPase n=1 Tax=candidate division WWE3 bacterium CG_4_9_14_0_2_um_filter_35_11 TaxID=1975077 RepID=A0A2M8EMW5_UNCKA|nr:MAG: hypothetical protein CO058_00110 [candidate division WWE3 bacterium CG_4_9_14_0_2_um_filter_35_11]